MAISLSNVTNNLSDAIHKIKCKYGHDYKKWETWEINYRCCNCFLEYTNFKDELIEYKCLFCNKNYQEKFNEKLKEWFFNTYKFSNHDNNKLVLLLQEDIYPYKYMEDWGKIQWNIITWVT